MKKNIALLVAAGLIAAITTGCVNYRSGNIASNVKPLGRTNEVSEVTERQAFTYDAKGNVLTYDRNVKKTPLAVDEGIVQGLIGAAVAALTNQPPATIVVEEKTFNNGFGNGFGREANFVPPPPGLGGSSAGHGIGGNVRFP